MSVQATSVGTGRSLLDDQMGRSFRHAAQSTMARVVPEHGETRWIGARAQEGRAQYTGTRKTIPISSFTAPVALALYAAKRGSIR